MNERIKELLEQAGVKYVTMPKDTVYEKFAELILEEVLAQVDEVIADLDKDGEKQQSLGAEWAGYAIAKHFGVK